MKFYFSVVFGDIAPDTQGGIRFISPMCAAAYVVRGRDWVITGFLIFGQLCRVCNYPRGQAMQAGKITDFGQGF
jgi:hypothetical protein